MSVTVLTSSISIAWGSFVIFPFSILFPCSEATRLNVSLLFGVAYTSILPAFSTVSIVTFETLAIDISSLLMFLPSIVDIVAINVFSPR